MEKFSKHTCIVCGLKTDNYKTCNRYCRFVYDKFCYLLPDGTIELTRDESHIKQKYKEKIEQEKARSFQQSKGCFSGIM